MARGVNRVTLLGNLGADLELRYTTGGTAVATGRVATTESWKDRESGERNERTEWHRVKLFGRQAETAAEYLKRGRQVYIEGALRTDEYEKDGVKHYSTEIVVQEYQLTGNRPKGTHEEHEEAAADA